LAPRWRVPRLTSFSAVGALDLCEEALINFLVHAHHDANLCMISMT
jgi:hypothetical protein